MQLARNYFREKLMRAPVFAIVVGMGLSLLLCGCGEKPIGQPCNFGWPKKADGTTNCDKYPACRPLQEDNGGVTLNNNACPIDCIQMPSLECENLICVATQIEGNSQNVNGVCWEPQAGEPVGDCPGAPVRCKGYCTKECLTDASCPKEYKCSAMAPFGSTLKCDDEETWDTECTANCIPGGTSGCPNSGKDADYGICDQKDYAACCACICYQFCPILTKDFCRKRSWDEKMFEDAITKNSECGQ
jgi:hypothetical protein